MESLEEAKKRLETIRNEERYHFTANRMIFILINFSCLFLTQFFYGQKDDSAYYIGETGKNVLFGLFIFSMLCLTYYGVNKIHQIHAIKKRFKKEYNFDPKDTKFDTV